MNNPSTTPILFITGTDTDAGKSWCTAAWLRHLRGRGIAARAVKPLVSGCPGGDPLSNADIRLLRQAQPEWTGPLWLHAFEPAIAPHIAARRAGTHVAAGELADWCLEQARDVDLLLVEGVGGWCVPLNEREMLSHWAQAMGAEVALVVAIRLGCINHGLLSARAIRADGLPLKGWLANWLDAEMPEKQANLASLQSRMPAPLLGQVEWAADPDAVVYRPQEG